MDDAILLDLNGNLAEATEMNIFLVKGNTLSVPTTVASLAGITRRVVLDIAGHIGLETLETDVTPHDLYTADEAFLTGTGAGIVPIEEVDGRVIGDKLYETVQKIMECYQEEIRKNSVRIQDLVGK